MPNLRLDGTSGSAVKAVTDLQKAFDKLGNEIELTAKESAMLDRAAGRIAKNNEQPLEKYNRRVAELAMLMRQGKLTTEQAEQAAKKYGVQLDRAGQSGRDAFGPRMLSNITAYLSGLVSIAGAAALFRSELEAIRAESEKTTATQVDAAKAEASLKRNIIGLPDAEREDVLQRATELATKTRLPQGQIFKALADTISARSGNVDEAMAILEIAAKVDRGEGLGEFAGAVGDIQNALRTDDPVRALGFLTAVAQQSRSPDLGKVARNAPSVINAVVGAGGDPSFGGALFAGLTVGGVDVTGERSATAGVQFVQRLGEFFEGTGAATDSFDEQIRKVLDDPATAQAFLNKFDFESKVQPAMEALLLDPNSPTRKSFEAAIGTLGTAEQQRAMGQRGTEFLTSGRLHNVQMTEETISSAIEQGQLSQVDPDLSGKQREDIVSLLARLRGRPRSFESFDQTFVTGATMSQTEAIGQLQDALSFSQSNTRGFRALVGTADAVDPADQRTAETLVRELRKLQEERESTQREIADSNERIAEALERMENSQPVRVPVPSGVQE